jgi:hypothetical protein
MAGNLLMLGLIGIGLWLGWLGVAILRGRSRVKSGIVAGLCLGAAAILIVYGVGVIIFIGSLTPKRW